MRRSTAIALTAANPGLAGLIATSKPDHEVGPTNLPALPYESWEELERRYPFWPHKQSDPNCVRHIEPTNWVTRWWFNRHRGQACSSCEQYRKSRR